MLITRERNVVTQQLFDKFSAFIDLGEEKGGFTRLCGLPSMHPVRGYHFAAAWLFAMCLRFIQQKEIRRDSLLLTPYLQHVLVWVIQLKTHAEKRDINSGRNYVSKEMPASIDQFIFQKIAKGKSGVQIANWFRDTFIKGWVYSRLQQEASLTQKALCFELADNYDELIKSLPECIQNVLALRDYEGPSSSTYAQILKTIKSPGYLRQQFSALELEDSSLNGRIFAIDEKEAHELNRIRRFLFG